MGEERVIFHLDMDAFYASIEQRDQPALRGKPVIVGSPPTQRGVVCAASYEARKYGVRSAMPSATAGRLCPRGIFVRPRMSRYRDESRAVMAIVDQTLFECGGTEMPVEPMSIDEAYLDVTVIAGGSALTGGRLEYEAALVLARRLKERIRAERGLTASIGIAPNKLLAKLASDFCKPDGLTLIPERDKVLFLRDLPARALHGVGRVTAEVLAKAGITTIGDLQDYPGNLRSLVGSFGPTLKRYSFGDDQRALEMGDEVKSISSEETFERDTDDRPVLRESLRQQVEDVAARLNRRRLSAHTIHVKLRYGDFTTLSRQITVEEPVVEKEEIFRLACFLLRRERLVSRPLRLLGVGLSGFEDRVAQQLLLM